MAAPNSIHIPATAAPITGACPSSSVLICGWAKQSAWGANNFIIPFELVGSNWWVVAYLHAVDTTHLGGTFQIFDPAFAWAYPSAYPPSPQWSDVVTQAERDGWIGYALQVVVGASDVTLRMWRCYGPGTDMVGPYEQTWAFNTVHSGWTPSALSSITFGENSGSTDTLDQINVRVYDRSTTPTNAEIKAILNSLDADTSAYADWPFNWSSGAVNTADQSGHSRTLTVAGSPTQGSAGPINPTPNEISHVGKSALASGTTGTTRTPDGSSIGLQTGDLLICSVLLRYTGAGTATISMPAGEGWALMENGRQSLLSDAWSVGHYYKFWGVGNTDDTTPTITVSGASKWGAILHAYRNVDPTTPIQASDVATATSSTMTAPSVTITGDGRALLRFFASTDNNSPNTASEGTAVISGTNVNVNTGSGYAMGASLLSNPSAGSSGTATMSQTANGADAYYAWTYVLNPIQTGSVAVTFPAREVSAAPTQATLAIVDDAYTFRIPYIQTSQTFAPTATVSASILPSGGGVKFVLDEGTGGEVVQYDTGGAGPFSASFTGVPKGVHTLDVYVVDSSNVVQGTYHDQVTGIGIGDIIAAIGDSATSGLTSNGGGGGIATQVHDWTEAAGGEVSTDNRNFRQYDPVDPGSGALTYLGAWPRLNNLLAAAYGYPVFVINEGCGGYNTSQTITRMGLTNWQNRIAALAPNKWLIHLGGNDTLTPLTKAQYKTNIQSIISTLVSSYGASATGNVWVARPIYLRNYPTEDVYEQDYCTGVDELVAASSCLAGPDFYTWFLNHPTEQDTPNDVHPNAAGYASTADLWAAILAASTLYTADLSEGVAVSEGVGAGMAASAGVAEGVAVSEGVGAGMAASAGVAEGVAVSEGVGAGMAASAGVAEGVAVSEGIGAGVAASAGVAEGVAVSEGVGAGMAASAGVAEGVAVSEGVGAGMAASAGVTEGVTVGEGVGTGGEQTYTADVSEDVAAGDGVGVGVVGVAALSETVAEAVAMLGQGSSVAAISEALGLSESVSGGLALGLALAESVANGETVGAALTQVAALVETVATGESAAASAASLAAMSEALGLSETASAGLAYFAGVSESVALGGGTLAAAASFVQAVGESVGITESQANQLAAVLQLADTLTSSESVAGGLAFAVGVSESIAALEATATQAIAAVGVSETATVQTALEAVRVSSLALSDAIVSAEELSSGRVLALDLSDAVTLADAVAAAQMAGVALSDLLASMEAVGIMATSDAPIVIVPLWVETVEIEEDLLFDTEIDGDILLIEEI